MSTGFSVALHQSSATIRVSGEKTEFTFQQVEQGIAGFTTWKIGDAQIESHETSTLAREIEQLHFSSLRLTDGILFTFDRMAMINLQS